MTVYQNHFKRYEKKYWLSPAQYETLRHLLHSHMIVDQYGSHDIYNLYYDTETDELIRQSIEQPLYKEKLRLRSYGLAGNDDLVYLELKKKFKGVVYKRRIQLPYAEASAFLDYGTLPKADSQILEELKWFIQRYQPMPKVFIAYERLALTGINNDALRMTFDQNLRYRTSDLTLCRDSWHLPLAPEGQVLLEIKTFGAMPLWLTQLLNQLAIYPASFSKYGAYYKQKLQSISREGVIYSA